MVGGNARSLAAPRDGRSVAAGHGHHAEELQWFAPGVSKLVKAVARYEEFRENVAFVATQKFHRPPEVSPSGQGYHWNQNAETYLLIGEGMGKAMIELLSRKAAGN